MRFLPILCLLGLALAALGCTGSPGLTADAAPADAGPPPPFPVNATVTPATAEGVRPAGRLADGTVILPGGRKITPTGTQIEVGGFLLGVRVMPGGAHVLTTDGGYYDNYLTLVSTADGTIAQREPFAYDQQRGLFLGLAIRADGRVYASGGGTNAVYVYDYAAASATPLTKVDEFDVGGYPAGLALYDDTHLLIARQAGGSLEVMDPGDGTDLGDLSFLASDDPYDVAVDPAHSQAFVSLWGSSQVAVVDLTNPSQPQLITKVAVGKNPSSLLLVPPAAPQRLLVAASDSDRIDVIDLTSHLLIDSVSVGKAVDAPRGASPNHLTLSPDGARLYVAEAGDNCIDVLDTASLDRIGRIPTAWYPTAVATAADGTLWVANAKGMGGGPSGGTGFDYGIMKGTLSTFAPPADADLVAGIATVDANNTRMRQEGPQVVCPAAPEECRFPLPPTAGLPTPIQHVVLIIRENKTYDATLGDLGTDADGDPSTVLFGEQYTPNLHKLARAFSNGDNFYSNAEASIQGHVTTSGAQVNDFTEKAWLDTWGRGNRSVADFAKRISTPESGTYFQRLARLGVEYMDYGEVVGLAGNDPGEPSVVFDPAWPGGIIFNTSTRERDKATYFASEVAAGRLAHFTYMLLPNNHTEGLSPGKWTPEFMVADNDEATGMVIDSIAHSPFWYSTVIFIIEDDPQDGADHVEAHRSTMVAVSPWVKRHYTSKVHYDVPALWATIELLLGIPPQAEVTANASPMFDLWVDTPDYTPYDYLPNAIPEGFNPTGTGGHLEEESRRMDFSECDRAPGLGRILWEHMKGTPAPWSSMPLPLQYDDEIEFKELGSGRAAPPQTGESRDSEDSDDDD